MVHARRDEGYEYEEAEDEGTERVELDVDEGWTRIESSGFGRMLLSCGETR